MNEHTDERKERHLKTIAVCLGLLVLILVLTNLSSFALLIRTLIFQYDRGCVAMPSNIGNASITKVRWEDGAITLEEAGATGHLDRAV